jgi:hypothetical protein
MEPAAGDHADMPRKPVFPSKLEPRTKGRRRSAAPKAIEAQIAKRPLHLGPWLRRMGLKQIQVARKAGIGKSYMSQLVSGKKDDPSALHVLAISEAMGVTVNALYRLPPTQQQVDQVRKLTPEQIVMMSDLVSIFGSSPHAQ